MRNAIAGFLGLLDLSVYVYFIEFSSLPLLPYLSL